MSWFKANKLVIKRWLILIGIALLIKYAITLIISLFS